MKLSFYRFFFKSRGVTVAGEIFQCDGDSAAMEQAELLLGASAFYTMEVWQSTRKVGVVERNSR